MAATTSTSPDYPTIATDIGLDLLRAADPALNGAGVVVAQVEANDGTSTTDPQFEVNPTVNAAASFTYVNGTASTTSFNTNTLGADSAHADYVASFFYGTALDTAGAPTGVAAGVTNVNVYYAGSFTTNLAQGYAGKVVNMSFTYTTGSVNSLYDQAANARNTVFVAAAGNSGTPAQPSTAWNVISVASSTATVAIGQAGLYDDKPDLSAPQSETSYTTPIVSGAAAILVQAGTAGLSGWTGTEKSNAVDFRVVKALLLNGAVKPTDYFTNSYAPTASAPLSARYGAGVVNVYNSVVNLYAGEDAAESSTTVSSGSTGFAALSAQTALGTAGWNLGTLSATATADAVNGYATSLAANTGFVATVTWASRTTSFGNTVSDTLDKIDLYLVNEATNQIVASSVASNSSVQQIDYTPGTAGRFDLFVRLEGSAGAVSDSYALAFAETDVACFAEGTRIATPHGPVPVDTLRPGDLVTLAGSGRAGELRWVGHRSLLHPQQDAPLRIAAHAFGPGRPCRDLRLSPEHAVHAEIEGQGVLVPIWALENGQTIRREHSPYIRYHHLLLDSHEILLAEDLPCESLLDADGIAFDGRLPDLSPLEPAFPRLTQGLLVEQLRERLAVWATARPAAAEQLPCGAISR